MTTVLVFFLSAFGRHLFTSRLQHFASMVALGGGLGGGWRLVVFSLLHGMAKGFAFAVQD
jgi:hypothetical protein